MNLPIVILCLLAFTPSLHQTSDAQKPSPNFSAEPCPNVSVHCPAMVESGERLSFFASVTGSSRSDLILTWSWRSSSGRIVRGQFDSELSVDTTGLLDDCVVGTVKVGGLKPECPNTAYCKSLVRRSALRFDSYGHLTLKDERERLNNLARQLNQEPNSEVSILAFDGSQAKTGTARRWANRAKSYLVSRHGIDPMRVRITADRDFVGKPLAKASRLDFYIRPHNLRAPCSSN